MIRRRTSPGFAEWLFVCIVVGGIIGILFQLYAYGGERKKFPSGLEVAGVDVGGLSRDEAETLLTDRYLNAPVIVRHGENPIELRAQRAEFTLDFDTMMTEATRERDDQDYWAGFWGYLWGRPIDVEPVPIRASHNAFALRNTLDLLAEQFDVEPRQPQPVAGTMSFQLGTIGVVTNVDASIADVERALYRPTSRSADLVIGEAPYDLPDVDLLRSSLTNTIQQYETSGGGRSSIFVINLNTGEEVGHNADLPMPGMSVLRIPIMVEALRNFSDTPTPEELTLLREAAIESSNLAANDLLLLISEDEEDGLIGAERLTASMQTLGLNNTFMACPFDYEDEFKCANITTEAMEATRNDATLEPSPYYQTTAKDMGLLLGMVYDCAERGGGTLLAMYSDDFSAEKCTLIIDILKENQIGSLIEEGVPADSAVAHRHGWQSDTNGDAGIIYSPQADYIVASFTHKPGWLAWEVSSPLMADLSRATYNFFNFEDQWLGQR